MKALLNIVTAAIILLATTAVFGQHRSDQPHRGWNHPTQNRPFVHQFRNRIGDYRIDQRIDQRYIPKPQYIERHRFEHYRIDTRIDGRFVQHHHCIYRQPRMYHYNNGIKIIIIYRSEHR